MVMTLGNPIGGVVVIIVGGGGVVCTLTGGLGKVVVNLVK